MVLTDMASYIVSQDPSRLLDFNLFRGFMPPGDAINAAASNTVLSLFEYGSLPSEHDLGTRNLRLVFPLVQAMCRGVKDDYDSPRLELEAIVAMFAGVINQTLGTTYYLGFDGGEPRFLNRDDNFRTSFIVNFKVMKRYSAT